jgi:mRNA-degrading endonuclease RelE of RelBE toxin-antitoxin system
LKIRLTPDAESQLRALPVPAARRIVSALRILQDVPNSGLAFPEDSPFRGSFYKTVVVRARRWSYRVIYDVRDEVVWIRFIYPSSHPLAE